MKKHLRNHGGAPLGRRVAGTIPSLVRKYMPGEIYGIGCTGGLDISGPNYDGIVSRV